MSVVFIQERAHRAGAQTCLMRLVRQPAIRALEPVVVAGEEGWLTRACAAEGIPFAVEPFPSSRSLTGRLWRNRAFVRRVARRVKATLVHGNDHQEGLLSVELARALRVPSALFLRSPTMTREDWDKYGCAQADFVAAVGEELQARAQGWSAGKPIALIHDGLEPSEFLAPKPPPARFPMDILVIGSPLEWKGWGDAIEVLRAFPELRVAFTGSDPGLESNALREAPAFLGRVENFRELVGNYALVFNPSWHESFGMAALEVLAAGVPLFSTRSGVIEQVVTDERWLARPRDVEEMRTKLQAIVAGWPGTALDVAPCQARIRERFMVERSAAKLARAYEGIRTGSR